MQSQTKLLRPWKPPWMKPAQPPRATCAAASSSLSGKVFFWYPLWISLIPISLCFLWPLTTYKQQSPPHCDLKGCKVPQGASEPMEASPAPAAFPPRQLCQPSAFSASCLCWRAPSWARSRWGLLRAKQGALIPPLTSWPSPCLWDLGHCCPCRQTNHYFTWTFDSVMIMIFFISTKGDPRNKHLVELVQ